ncbi:MAG: tRNA guanosine(34) transglycosylase Tgt [bacterium]
MISFHLIKQSNKSRARLGILKTPHGEILTPAIVPVATQATIKTLSSDEVIKTKSQLVICNTYHLHLRPGETVVKKAGGLHSFMNWQKPVMTDSGGYQVFSLGFGTDYGVGKILKKQQGILVKAGAQPQKVKLTEDGVYFRSHIDGSKLFIGPKESICIQEKLGADIIFAFDECTPTMADYEYTKISLDRTHRWAKRCLREKRSDQALYGIVQGGKYKDLRIESARYLSTLPFDGFGIGGEFGYNKRSMNNMLRWVVCNLPSGKPRHLLGIGHPEDIPNIIRQGIDTFDCIVPTHYGRHGVAFTSRGRLDVRKSKYLKDMAPLDRKCMCEVCGTYSRSYIAHLFRAKEITGLKLVSFHNLFFFNTFVERIREKIKNDEI